ncbi:MAG: class I SAM-dependent methyltransferase, partial [Methyloligellaceae bacterium]
DPDFGYYRERDPFGRDGDFVTAPEISQIFGELIGLWCVEVWRGMGQPAGLRLIELGPGRGTLMADALRAARLVPAFLDAAELHLIETSPALKRRQAETLQGVGPDPRWHDALTEVPAGPAVVVANEFLDALPVRQFVHRADRWHERCVGMDQAGGLTFCTAAEALEDCGLIPPGLRADAREDAIVEVRPAATALLEELGRRGARHDVAALIIDYGHTKHGLGETLQGVRRHGYADPLADIGAVDLTAHVDFATLADVARGAGLRVWGPIAQSEFLLGLGLAQRCEKLVSSTDPTKARAITAAAARLVEPGQMGDLFKVVALTNADRPPPPFGEPTKEASADT